MRPHLLLLCAFASVAVGHHNSHRFRNRVLRGNSNHIPFHDVDGHSNGTVWAVLVAGSNGWYNYRHQADVAHAFHVLVDHGVKQKNIITMMYDDVAHSSRNPYPGKLFNHPDGEDVYENLLIDYKKNDVTPENFINILKGNSTGIKGGNGKFVNSKPTDRIFVYFADHGATGLVSFPNDILTVKTLNDALSWMYKNDRYSQLTFYLEACESGSMFEDITKKNINVYAVTAANSNESSWGTYCDNDLGLPCLGDLFSVNWMFDSDFHNLNLETLEIQYERVKKATDKSHVQKFGDMYISKEPVAYFQGNWSSDDRVVFYDQSAFRVSWPSRDVKLMELLRKRNSSTDFLKRREYNIDIKALYEMRKVTKIFIQLIVDEVLLDSADNTSIFETRNPVWMPECHHQVVHAFHNTCINLNANEYALKYIYVLNNLCMESINPQLIIEKMKKVCPDGVAKFVTSDSHPAFTNSLY